MEICSQCKKCDSFIYNTCAIDEIAEDLESGKCFSFCNKDNTQKIDTSGFYSTNRNMTDEEMDLYL